MLEIVWWRRVFGAVMAVCVLGVGAGCTEKVEPNGMNRPAIPAPPQAKRTVQAVQSTPTAAGALPTGCSTRPCVLLVDDSRGGNAAAQWSTALTQAGITFTTAPVTYGATCNTDGAPGAMPSLTGWDLVILTFGDQAYSNLSAANESDLVNYLDGGGRLVVNGMHMAYDEPNAGTLYGTYLAIANYTFSMPAGAWSLNPTGHEICGSATLTLNTANPSQPCYQDMGSTWDLAAGGQGCGQEVGGKYGISTHEVLGTDSYRTVAMGFAPAQVTTAEFSGLVQRTRDWIFRPHSVTVGPSTCTAGVACSLTASAEDITGLPLTFSWDLNNDGTFGDQVGTAITQTFATAGTSTVQVKVTNALSEAIVPVAITVQGPPVAQPDSFTTDEDQALDLTLSGTDPNGDVLTFAVDTAPAHGALTGTAPDLTYTPDPDFTGTDSFTFTANDGALTSSPATISITINPVNDAPVANAVAAATNEDVAQAVVLDATDVDGDPLTFAIVTPPAHGSLSGTGQNLTYSPIQDFNGTDTFTFKANDGTVDSNVATVTVTVSAVNDAPTAVAQSIATDEDTAAAIVLSGVDVEGSTLTYAIVSPPSHGTLTGTAPNLTYAPAPNFHGSDAFTFKVNDGALDSTAASVSVTVAAVNDAPVATAQSAATTTEDAAKALTLAATDVDGDPLTFVVVTPPAHGTLTGTAPNLTYAPDADYHGTDSFTFKANDGTIDSAPAAVSLTITPVNDAPVATAQTATTAEDTVVAITLAGTDIDGDSLNFAVVTPPAHGSLSGTAPNLTYTPAADYNGSDSFTFKANDGTVDSAPALVSLTISAVNDAPVANAQTVTTTEDSALAVTLGGSDVDGDPIVFAVLTPPAHGSLSGTSPNLTYTPAADFNGSDSFAFRVNDGAVDSALATVSITVTPVNDAPFADAQSFTTDEDSPATLTLTGSDVDGDPLSFAVVTPPAHGTLTGTAPNLTYVPAADYNGSDSFEFKSNDGALDSPVVTVAVTITPVNDAPIATTQSLSTAEDAPVAVTLGGTDVDADPLSFVVVSPPVHGTLTGTAPNLSYVPAADFNGSDSLTFKANDGTVDSAPTTISLTVTPVNDPPVASAQTVSTNEDSAAPITLSATDTDGDPLTFAVATAPAHGTLSGTAPNLTYTPDPDFNGTDTFTFTSSDASSTSNEATVTITVAAVNDAPVAAPQVLIFNQGDTMQVTLSGSDVDGDSLTYSVVASPADGTLSGAAPDLTWEPPVGFRGETSFTFKVNDGQLDSTEATVTLKVNNGAPMVTISADSLQPQEGQVVAFSSTAADPGNDTLTFTWDFGDESEPSSDNAPTHAFANQGSYTVTVTVSDGLQESSATLDIVVTNAAPVLVPESDTAMGEEGKELTFAATVTDPGAQDTWTVQWSWGDGSPDSEGSSVTHVFADDGEYTVSITVTDVDGAVTTGSRQVTISNLPPVPDQLPTVKVTAGELATAQLTAVDAAKELDPLSWTLVEGPGSVTPEGQFEWQTSATDKGTFVIRAQVDDGDQGTAESVFSVEVTPAPEVKAGGCGCDSNGPSAANALWLGLLAAVVMGRRRARA